MKLTFIRAHLRSSAAILFLCLVAGCALADGTWRQALPGFVFEFPRDHASHPDYKIEWWYYTGNLASREGRRFGYQLTFFRVGVEPQPKNPSRWAVRDLFMAHFAVTDISGQKYFFFDRMNRAGIGWAGAESSHYRVWNQDWEARLFTDGRHELNASDSGLKLTLVLSEGKRPVMHGVRGISQKGSEAGNASHYYSLTRMPTQGTLALDGQIHTVEGQSWMDHEFGTSFLGKEQKGWDWFSIQLEDGSDLMLFQLRRSDGSIDRHSSGTWVGSSGESRSLEAREFFLKPGAIWRSTTSGARYPLFWEVNVPSRGLKLAVRAVLPHQELHTEKSTGVTYWEGAIEVRGTHNGKPAQGRGYLEMTGYAGQSISEKFR
ncbi:MAG: carotenoid 1,2-hydratase [Acidobacteria bacterium]|nr:carotenoid 1,2-hydratase [Acidobacteriota bacterium]MCI0721701.1 carotenoid 1,2-hydratase [Acidobacteriota bacterium]